MTDVTNSKHRPDECILLFSAVRSEVLVLCMERERKKEIGVDRGLENLE